MCLLALIWRQKCVAGVRHGNSHVKIIAVLFEIKYIVPRQIKPGMLFEIKHIVPRQIKPRMLLFEIKYIVPRQIKPGMLKLSIRRGQSNFSIVFILVSCEEKGYYHVFSVRQFSFDCRSNFGSNRRMQGIP